MGRAGSPHQDATLEFLNPLTPPHPHSQSVASRVYLETGRETILCLPRASGKDQDEDLGHSSMAHAGLSTLWRQRQEGLKSEASLGYIVNAGSF